MPPIHKHKYPAICNNNVDEFGRRVSSLHSIWWCLLLPTGEEGEEEMQMQIQNTTTNEQHQQQRQIKSNRIKPFQVLKVSREWLNE
jgi:hypothetical protein